MEKGRGYFPRSTRSLATPLCIKNKDGGYTEKRRDTTNKIMEENKQERTRKFEYKERKHNLI
jgi:hypothetical protein